MTSFDLRNDRIALTFDGSSGALRQIRDLDRQIDYLDPSVETIPFRLFTASATVPLEGFTRFTHEVHDHRASLLWELEDARIRAEVELLDDGVQFTAGLEALREDTPAYAIEYPLIQGLQDGTDTHLAHSYATGILIADPIHLLPTEGTLRFVPYPEGFSGATMQLMSFYHADGGLYLAAHDGAGHQKWLNAYTELDLPETLTLSHMYGFEDLRSGRDVQMPYPFVLRLTDGGAWETSATLYREFALEQPWCSQGPVAEQAPETRAAWLHEEVGYTTFGVNAGHDRSHWLTRYRQDIGTPGFHVLGPDWTNKPQTFGSGIPGGLADWLPTRFSQETLDAIRSNGDRFAPFEFDFLVATTQSQQEELKHNLQHFPSPSFSHDGYRFPMLCPGQSFTEEFHRLRDLQVWEEAGVDAMYYDISANNLIRLCVRDDHEHAPGGGKALNDGYRHIFATTGAALSQAAGERIPLGTEMYNEVFLDRLAYYQARAWAQPASALEAWPFLGDLSTGQVQMIPYFDMVYHEYGAVRMDGWGKLVDEIGELYYDTVAKTYLWGGLYEINHEYSPMELLDGQENTEAEHYAKLIPRGYEYQPERAVYLGMFAQARIGAAKPYWAYGQMLPTPPLSIPQEDRKWFHYNHGEHAPTFEASGSHSVPTIRHSAYKSPDGKIALFFANSSEAEQPLSLDLSALAAHYGQAPHALSRIIAGEAEPLLSGSSLSGTLEQRFGPRSIYMLEFTTP